VTYLPEDKASGVMPPKLNSKLDLSGFSSRGTGVKFTRLFVLIVLFLPVLAQAGSSLSPMDFDWRKDTIAFSNDTAFAYGVDERGELTMHRQANPPQFTHRCFVLSRAVIQFHKFVRFEPKSPRTTPSQYRALVRHICRIPVWVSPYPGSKKIVIPGYANLYEFSRAYEHMLKEELGNWRPTFFRVGNWRMVGPFPRFGQQWAANNLMRGIDRGKLQAVYITRFPRMNHVLVLFAYHRLANGNVRFDVYDPNSPGQLSSLTFNQKERGFEFPKRWFWTGGRVNLFRVYLSPFH